MIIWYIGHDISGGGGGGHYLCGACTCTCSCGTEAATKGNTKTNDEGGFESSRFLVPPLRPRDLFLFQSYRRRIVVVSSSHRRLADRDEQEKIFIDMI